MTMVPAFNRAVPPQDFASPLHSARQENGLEKQTLFKSVI
jgi:hypothetical protein